jgi:hypothetical protein
MSKKLSGHFWGAVLAAVFSMAAITGCDDNNNSTETLLTGDHCNDACERYAVCFNTSFDVNTCQNNCEAALANTSISLQTTQDCVDCIGTNLCSSATYDCAAVCGGIIVIDI